METPNDYEEEQQGSSDDFNLHYERPVFLYSGRNVVKKPKKVKKVQRTSSRLSNKPESKHVTPAQLLLVKKCQESSQTARKGSKGRTKSDNSDKYYEYGDYVDGYRFVGTKKELLDFESSKIHNLKQRFSPVNPNAFDQLRAPEMEHFTTCEYIEQYWSQDKELSAQKFPLLGNTVRIDDITRAGVEQFYLRSCSQMGFDLVTVLKGERLRWHPDRLIGKLTPEDELTLKKITKLFQIINDLWESQKCT